MRLQPWDSTIYVAFISNKPAFFSSASAQQPLNTFTTTNPTFTRQSQVGKTTNTTAISFIHFNHTTTTTAAMSPARRALIAITSAQATLFQGKETTGLFISEALHPFKVLTAAGFEVDLASETGSYTPDWLSQQPDFLNGEDLAIWNDTNSDFRRKLDNMPRAADVDGSQYGVFYASAGHAALIDYPTATNLQRIASQVWANGGVVSSVCHGPAIFHGVADLATNEPLIKGKIITGFTSEAEVTMGIMDELRAWNSPMVEELAEKLGATCKRALQLLFRPSNQMLTILSF
jgi:putative intracellular protease/amidase